MLCARPLRLWIVALGPARWRAGARSSRPVPSIPSSAARALFPLLSPPHTGGRQAHARARLHVLVSSYFLLSVATLPSCRPWLSRASWFGPVPPSQCRCLDSPVLLVCLTAGLSTLHALLQVCQLTLFRSRAGMSTTLAGSSPVLNPALALLPLCALDHALIIRVRRAGSWQWPTSPGVCRLFRASLGN